MASLKKLPANKQNLSKKAPLLQQLQAFLSDVFVRNNLVNPQLLLAYSGGLDSTVLLHLLVQVNKSLPFQLSAQHVHHGLSANADAWAAHCASACQQLHVPLALSKVSVNQNGLGVEAAAREARYDALNQTQADFILLAHHQNDQAETFLLQLARGAGVKGLAGMAAQNGKLLRPLLNAPRKALLDYAKQHNLTWVEDESNAQTQYDRNYMRLEVLPVLAKQFPAIHQTISRSAQHMADANDLLDEIASQDTQQCLEKSIENANVKVINLQQLQQLSNARIHNVLRWWLVQNGGNLPSSTQLQQIVQQFFTAKTDAMVKLQVGETLTLQRYRNCAFLQASDEPLLAMNLLWQGEEKLMLSNGTSLQFKQVLGQGFALNRVPNIKLRIKNREGGERFKPDLARPSRSLKTVFQQAEMPPWQRAQLPLVFMDETLVIIPNIAVDASWQAAENEIGLVVTWYDAWHDAGHDIGREKI